MNYEAQTLIPLKIMWFYQIIIDVGVLVFVSYLVSVFLRVLHSSTNEATTSLIDWKC